MVTYGNHIYLHENVTIVCMTTIPATPPRPGARPIECGILSLQMQIVIENENPSVARLVDFQDSHGSIKESLTFTDKAAVFTYTKFKKNRYLLSKMGPERYQEEVDRLKTLTKKTLLFQDDKGYYTYSGLAPYLAKKSKLTVENQVKYPAPKKLAWNNIPKFEPYPYQSESLDLLLEVKHGGVELGTGLGKSYIIQLLCRSLGRKTIVMTPATSISAQLYKEFVNLFGKKLVGQFFDGKKESGKLIVIANAQSLTKVVEGSKEWNDLSSSEVFIADESHQCPASTFEKVCFGVAAKAPYRFFFSATQLRNDGKDLLLEGITGSLVFKKTVYEGIMEKYLAKPVFRMLNIPSPSLFESSDANEMTREHLYYNPKVAEQLGKLVNASVDAGFPTLVLIEEVEQFTKLLPYLRHEVGFAHGTLADNKEKVPKEYWDSDNDALVKSFNDCKLPILVGTSCISTGTNIQPARALVYWKGGKSEIEVKQSIGRGTRLFPGKDYFIVFDVDVYNQPTLHRHSDARREIYRDLYPDLKESFPFGKPQQ